MEIQPAQCRRRRSPRPADRAAGPDARGCRRRRRHRRLRSAVPERGSPRRGFPIAAMAAAVGRPPSGGREPERPKPQHRYPAGRARHQPGVHLSSDDQRAPLSRLDGRLASVQRVPLRDQDGRWSIRRASIRINTSPGAISSTAGSVTPTSPPHIARWDAQELEDAANAQGHTLCIARSPEEWLAHPHGGICRRSL